ncbi:3-oxoacyl-ACP synthase III family protein [Nereida ignava]|uniref:3-oxoacyl-ACP synthase III family protein n=1 Tax=Nereida ignava TaxID=282199 RepID=UPI002FE29EF7
MTKIIISHCAPYFPKNKLSNEDICELSPHWSPEKILAKTGIESRNVSAEGETSVDLAIGASNRLFNEHPEIKDRVQYIIFCTQTPDYFLPTSACILQDKLGLKTAVGAIDINQGCSGFVYGLSLAKGLIAAGVVENVLLLTADTYTKLINPKDVSVRTLFGDGACATFVEAKTKGQTGLEIGSFVFGTDGAGYKDLIVPAGGFRLPTSQETAIETQDIHGNNRSQEQLYMDGSKIMIFGLSIVPDMIKSLLAQEFLELTDIDHFIFHQASLLLLQKLAKKLKLPPGTMPIELQYNGNTVSSTIPITLSRCLQNNRIQDRQKIVLAGFGVGLSWAACTLTT